MTEPLHMTLARRDLGVHERLGDELNPIVRAYFAHTKFPAKLVNLKTMWCGAFVSAKLEAAKVKSPRSARADHFATFGEAVALEDAEPGDVVVLDPISEDSGASGHVAFFAGWNSNRFGDPLLLGGNQDNQVKIKAFPRRRVVAVRRAKTA